MDDFGWNIYFHCTKDLSFLSLIRLSKMNTEQSQQWLNNFHVLVVNLPVKKFVILRLDQIKGPRTKTRIKEGRTKSHNHLVG